MNSMLKPNVWHKSTRSGPWSDACVDVIWKTSSHFNEILVRDTKDKGNGPTLSFSLNEWKAFLDGVREGEFDIKH